MDVPIYFSSINEPRNLEYNTLSILDPDNKSERFVSGEIETPDLQLSSSTLTMATAASTVTPETRGRPSARRAAAGFLRRMVSSDDVSKKVNKAPVLARARSVHSSDAKDGTKGAKSQSDRRARALSSPRNSLSVDEILECPICLERLKRPKMLPCQHTFCLSCLEVQQIASSNKKINGVDDATATHVTLQCPTCRLEVQLSREKGLSSLPPNLYIESLLRVVKTNGGAVNLGGPQQQKRQQVQINPQTVTFGINTTRCSICDTTCEARSCEHCKQVLCEICWPSHVDELRTQLSGVRQQLESARQRLRHRQEDFKARCDHLQERVAMAVEIKMQTLRDIEQQLTNETLGILTVHEASANVLHERLERQLVATNPDEQQFECADDATKVSMFLRAHRVASELLSAVGHWGETRPTLDEDSLKIDCLPPESSPQAEEAAGTTTDCRLIDPENLTADSLSLYYRSRSIQPRLKLGRGAVQRPAGLGVAPWANNTELYVAAADAHVVVVFDKRNGRHLRQLANSEPPNQMLCPSAIAFCGIRAEIYVSDKWRHCVHVFARDGRYLRQLGNKGRSEGLFLAPEGLACDSEAGVLYVSDTCNDRVQVVSLEDGRFVRQLCSSAPRTEFNQPTSVALGGDRVVVCDHGNRRIKVYSRQTGQRVLEFGSLGVARGQFRSPECVAVDKMGFILVGDSGNGRVQIFRPGGQSVRAFGRFSWVSGLHVTSNFEIYVSDSKGHCISIYS